MNGLLSHLGLPLTAGALCLFLASNLIDLGRTHSDLERIGKQQAVAIASDAKVQSQLDGLAKGTQQLALAGNANALKIIAILRQNGVNIK